MSSTLHFPNSETIKSFLFSQGSLSHEYYKKKGITKAVADLAAKRFANRNKGKTEIRLGTMFIIHDLRNGHGFTGEQVADLGKLGLPDFVWKKISKALEAALVDCAES